METDSSNKKPENTSSKKDGNPGAAKYGNFMNYYQFHPPEDRINHLPVDVWLDTAMSKAVCLDIGCNSGDLTQEMFEHIKSFSTRSESASVKQNECFILGIDIDPVLVSRAEESNRFKDHITFRAVDIMRHDSQSVINEFLKTHSKERFDAIFCFSVTMWIHLNHGDKGLKQFLSNLCQLTELLIIEPQPWKCYLTAVRRFKKCNTPFPNLHQLRMNKNVDKNIESIIQNKHKFQKVFESCPNSWGRKIVFFKSRSTMKSDIT